MDKNQTHVCIHLKEPYLDSMPVPIVSKSFVTPLHHQIDKRLFNQKYTAHENFWKKIYHQRFFIYLPLTPLLLKRFHIPTQDIWDDFIKRFPPLNASDSGIFIVCPIHPTHFIVIQSLCTTNWLFVAKDWQHLYINQNNWCSGKSPNLYQRNLQTGNIKSLSEYLCLIAHQFQTTYQSPLFFRNKRWRVLYHRRYKKS